jgi:hypothetical protein
MGYQVFLLSRIRERYDITAAIASGLGVSISSTRRMDEYPLLCRTLRSNAEETRQPGARGQESGYRTLMPRGCAVPEDGPAGIDGH